MYNDLSALCQWRRDVLIKNLLVAIVRYSYENKNSFPFRCFGKVVVYSWVYRNGNQRKKQPLKLEYDFVVLAQRRSGDSLIAQQRRLYSPTNCEPFIRAP